jgi:predicted dehydrogenase
MTIAQIRDNAPIRVAFLGGGIDSAVGAAHFAAIEMDKKFEVVSGCFGRSQRINHASGVRYRIAPERVHSSLSLLVEAEKNHIDAVVVLTPTDQHFEHVSFLIEAGIPVICEKALTSTVTQSTRLVELVKNSTGFLSVIFNYTGYPALREIRKFIQDGKLGHVHQLNVEMPQEGFLRRDREMNPVAVQDWRLRTDVEIPTVSLDLGVHLHSLITYLTGEQAVSVIAHTRSNGHFDGIADNVMAIIQCSNELDVKMWFSKTALGHRNGLRIEAFGKLGSISWAQEQPEIFNFADCFGNKRIFDRGCLELSVSREERYQRFKAGHPAGFIEALSNYYWDIDIALREYLRTGKAAFFPDGHVFNGGHAADGMKLMEALQTSSCKRTWIDLSSA